MWIAKPVRDLEGAESGAWNEALERARARDGEAPLSQTLEWARAIDAVSGRSYAVLCTEERVGGIVFASVENGAIRFECVNGPLLDWDDAERLPRQLATFADRVSRLHPRFGSMSLRPRWTAQTARKRLRNAPIAPFATTRASTLKLDLDPGRSPDSGFSPRLRRTLKASDLAGATASWLEVTPAALAEFAPRMTYFARSKGFTAPPVAWFLALTQPQEPRRTPPGSIENPASPTLPAAPKHPVFGLVRATAPGSECQLLVALHQGEAHYLFGHESRAPDARAAHSASAVAHRLAIRRCAALGLERYDFNGALDEGSPPDHPYTGVDRFKSQFGATKLAYEVPEFRIV